MKWLRVTAAVLAATAGVVAIATTNALNAFVWGFVTGIFLFSAATGDRR